MTAPKANPAPADDTTTEATTKPKKPRHMLTETRRLEYVGFNRRARVALFRDHATKLYVVHPITNMFDHSARETDNALDAASAVVMLSDDCWLPIELEAHAEFSTH